MFKTQKQKSDKITDKWYFYVCCFWVACFIGWIYEVVWEFKVGHGFVNRGLLHGFYLPVYGFGAMILLFSLKKLVESRIKIGPVNISPILVFAAIFLIVSVVEFIASYILEIFFDMELWNYSYDKLNIDGRVSVRNSSLLAICGMAYLYIVHPFLKWFLPKLQSTALKIIAATIIIVMLIDFIWVLLS